MRRDKKPITRWIGEALLIFLSVLGAFYFDNLRDGRSQENLYIRHLKDFKSDLEENQGKLAYELNPDYDPGSGKGFINGTINRLDSIHSLMTSPSRANADTLLSRIENGEIVGLTMWIYVSPQYERLSSQFYSFIQSRTLKARIQMHYRNNQSRIDRKVEINRYVGEFHNIEDQLNFNTGPTVQNRNILFDNVTVNKIRRLIEGYQGLRHMSQSNKSSDSLLLIQVNEELKLWGELD